MKITQRKKLWQWVPAALLSASVCLAASGAWAGVISLSGDASQTTPNPFYFSSITTAQALARTLDDPFAYDPLSPTSPLPDMAFNNAGSDGYHANNGTAVTLAYTFGDAFRSLFFDLYGRNVAEMGPGGQLRDNNLTLELYHGGWAAGDLVHTSPSFDISDVAPEFARYTAPASIVADRVKINGPDPNFTLMEIRANGIPEPSVALLAVAGGLLLRRRRWE